MFIRWQRRDTSPTKREHKMRLAAVLVESARVDGKPSQRHIAYLANIIETEIDDVRRRCQFWERVVRKLDKLGNRVLADDRQKLEQAIGQRVPCPTEGSTMNFAAPA
jgi:hypothetical protein